MAQLGSEMGVAEFMEWMSYEMTQSPETKEQLTNELALEKSAKKDTVQRADDIAAMFKSLTSE